MGTCCLHSVRVLVLTDTLSDSDLVRSCLAETQAKCEFEQLGRLEQALSERDVRQYDALIVGAPGREPTEVEETHRLPARLAELPAIVITDSDDQEPCFDAIDTTIQVHVSRYQLTGHTLDRSLQHAIQRQHSQCEIRRLTSELKARELRLDQQQIALAEKNGRLGQLHKTGELFIDNVSHEFRTPLTVIKDYIALVRDGLAGYVNDEQCRMLDIAAVRADDLGQMIDDLLDISKFDAGLLGVWRRNCCVTDIIRQMQLALERKARVMGITFEVNCPDHLPQVYCDAEQVSHIVGNLVFNAFRCSADSGLVQLWAAENATDKEVVIGVTDRGPGIDDEARQLIFQVHSD